MHLVIESLLDTARGSISILVKPSAPISSDSIAGESRTAMGSSEMAATVSGGGASALVSGPPTG